MEQRKEKNICISTDDDILNILNISTALATEPQLLPHGPSYWGDPRYSASQVNFSFDNKVAFIFKEFNLKAAELQSALASLPKSFSSQLSQYAQYSNLQQVYLCSRV